MAAVTLSPGAQAAPAAVELERQAVAVLVEAVVGRHRVSIAAAGRSGVEEVYGVLYLDVGCDVCFSVALAHHFSPLITAIRREH
ncbi:MAG: hypothetical protein ACYDA0_06905 [Candidatus Dormibacteraceae bacterium]